MSTDDERESRARHALPVRQPMLRAACACVVWLCLDLTLLGCQSKLDVHTSSGGALPAQTSSPSPPPSAQPIDLGSSGSQRVFFQTESVITIGLTDQEVPPGSNVSLENATTGKVIIQNQSLLSDPVPDAGYALVGSASGGYTVTLTLYPVIEAGNGDLTYGDNDLRIDDEGGKGDVAKETVHLEDFSVFGQQGFDTTSLLDSGLDLWMNDASDRPYLTEVDGEGGGWNLTMGAYNNLISD